VTVFLELIRLHDLSRGGIELFLIVLFVFLDNVLADVSVPLFDFLCNFHGVLRRNGLSTVSHLLQDELGDIFSSKRNVSHAAGDNEAI